MISPFCGYSVVRRFTCTVTACCDDSCAPPCEVARASRQHGAGWLACLAWLLLLGLLGCQDRGLPQPADPAQPDPQDIQGTSQEPEFTLAELLLSNDGGETPPENKPIVSRPAIATPQIDNQHLTALDLRQLQGKYLRLITDLPASPAVDELPEAFDQAVPIWAEYFDVPMSALDGWQVTGYLMADRERFVKGDLLPEELPQFLHGYQLGDQIWVLEQPSDYYRRHLVLHEGVHAFMHHTLGGSGPPWYREGMAELLATHHWQEGQLQVGVMPSSKEDVPEWGRIKLIRDEFAAGRGMMLRDIASFEEEDFLNVGPYAWSWAACAYLDGHPDYRGPFRSMRRHVLLSRQRFNQRFDQQVANQLRELDEQWQLFVLDADYGYDFARASVSYRPAAALPEDGANFRLDVDHTWQGTGYRLEAGKQYSISAEGRYQIAQGKDAWMAEPNGITLRYHAGLPLGMLIGNIRPDEAGEDITNLARPIPIGLRRRVVPVESGELYLKINEHPAEWADNLGEIRVRIDEVPSD